MELVVENLNLDDFDINDIKNEYESDLDDELNSLDEINDIDELNDLNEFSTIDSDINNIIYSYPFYSDDVFDYEYRISLIENNLILDEVKCDDNESDFDSCVIFVKNIFNKPLEEALHFIKNLKEECVDEVIIFDFKDKSEAEKENIIDNNRKIVLKELFTELMNAL